MEDMEFQYKGEFTIEQRKAMTAEVLRELRKGKKLSQKEVAACLNIPATTYNTYESGRTEPPIEILVRLSHLYQVSIDLIVQRNRTYRTSDDVVRQLAKYKEQVAELERQMSEGSPDTSGMSDLVEVMGRLADAMTAYSQTEAVKKALDTSKPN